MKVKTLALLEVLFVYALIRTFIVSSHPIELVQQEKQIFGWVMY